MRFVLSATMHRLALVLAALAFAASSLRAQTPAAAPAPAEDLTKQPGIISSEFIAREAPTALLHASTIVEINGQLLASWAGGSGERSLDSSIWLSRYSSLGWSDPVEVANGLNNEARTRQACWNPVLFSPTNGFLCLFYKEGPNPAAWWGLMKTSKDNGKTWSKPKRLFPKYFGAVRNKPIKLDNGYVLGGSSVEDTGWISYIERTHNVLDIWTKSKALNSSMEWSAIQPTLLAWADGGIQALCRTRQGKITQCWSYDKGVKWTPMIATELPNPNSAVDAVMLKDNRALLVYNHSQSDKGVLNVALSTDGRRWQAALVLENEPGAEHSYPAVIQGMDDRIHITYSWKKKGIKHVILDPGDLTARPMVNGAWPK